MSSQVGTLLGSSMPHGTQAAAGRRLRRIAAVDRDPVAAVRIALDADRVGAIALLDIVVPHGGRLADVAVCVDDAVCHLFPPRSLARLRAPQPRCKEKPPVSRTPIRIAVLHFAHETVTFLKNDTTLDDFIYPGSPAKGEALLAHDPQVLHGRLREGGARVRRGRAGRHRIAAVAQDRHRLGLGHRGGLRDLRRQDDRRAQGAAESSTASISACTAPWACAAWRGPRPSSRGGCARWSGRDAFIVGTFDPHGNEDEEFLQHADMAFTVKYFPHYDSYLQGERAARMLVRAIRGDYKPSTVTQRRCRSSRRPCCNGPAPRRGWTWCSARSPGRRASPTSM